MSQRRPEASDDLWKKLKSSNEETALKASDAIVRHYQYLVESVARKLESRLPSYLEDDELVSLGQIGLLKAIDKYELERGPFSRYASAIIFGSIIDGLRALDFAPRGLRKKQRTMNQAIHDLRGEGITSPTVEDIAGKLGVSESEVRNIQHRVVRADVTPSDPTLLPTAGHRSTEEEMWTREMCREFVRWLKGYDDLTQKVVLMRYWKAMTMKQISEELQVPPDHIRISHQAILSDILPFMQDLARDY